MTTALIVVLFIAIVILAVFGRTILMRLFGDKMADSIDNAIARKKNEKNPPQRTKLSDSFKSDDGRDNK